MRRKSGFGWLELILGILLVILGIFSMINPNTALTGIVIVYGIAAIVIGISDIMMYVRVERYTGFGPMVSLIGGILSVMSGVMLLVYPNAGKWVLSLLFPIWFIAHCISRLAHLSSMRIYMENFAYYLTLILNILGLISGFMMIFHPFVSLLSVSYIIGLYLILLGIDCIVIAFSKISSNH